MNSFEENDWNRLGLVFIIQALGAYFGQLTMIFRDVRLVDRYYDPVSALAFLLIWGLLLVWTVQLQLDALSVLVGGPSKLWKRDKK